MEKVSLVFFLTLTLLAIIFFAVSPHHLNQLELTMVVLVITYLNSNYLDIVFLNFERIKIHEEPVHILAFYTTALLLCPVVILWGVDRYFALSNLFKKVLLSAVILLILLGIEYFAEAIKVFHYENWYWWQTFIKWLAIWILSILVTKLFHKVLLKELKR